MKVYNYDYICECGNRITCDDDILFELRNRSNQSYMPVKRLSHVERKLGVPISGYDKKDRVEYTSKCCIKCKRPLPEDACLVKSYKIPIIGRRSSGKTVFSLAMNEIIPAINRTMAAEKNHINIEWKDAYSKKETIFIRERKRLINEFRMGELPDPTRNVQKMPPINYIITNSELNMKVMFQFYDLPGESTGTNGRLAKDSPILRADAVLFIVDWNDLGKNQMLEVGETHAAILNEYIHAKRKKTIPFLICITKGDLIFDAKGYQYDDKLVDLFMHNTLKKNRVIEVSAHNNGFDEKVNKQRNEVIKDYFHKNHFTTLEQLFGNIDEDYIQFFLVSSLNDMIDNNSFAYDKWMPNRIEEPLLYLMSRYSLYPTKNYDIQYAREESFLGKDREPFKLWHTFVKKIKPIINSDKDKLGTDSEQDTKLEDSELESLTENEASNDYIETTLYDTHEIKQGPYKSLNIEKPVVEKIESEQNVKAVAENLIEKKSMESESNKDVEILENIAELEHNTISAELNEAVEAKENHINEQDEKLKFTQEKQQSDETTATYEGIELDTTMNADNIENIIIPEPDKDLTITENATNINQELGKDLTMTENATNINQELGKALDMTENATNINQELGKALDITENATNINQVLSKALDMTENENNENQALGKALDITENKNNESQVLGKASDIIENLGNINREADKAGEIAEKVREAIREGADSNNIITKGLSDGAEVVHEVIKSVSQEINNIHHTQGTLEDKASEEMQAVTDDSKVKILFKKDSANAELENAHQLAEELAVNEEFTETIDEDADKNDGYEISAKSGIYDNTKNESMVYNESKDVKEYDNNNSFGNPHMTILNNDDSIDGHNITSPKSLYSRKFGSDFIYLDLQKESNNTDKYENDDYDDYEINYAYQDKIYRKIQKLRLIRRNVLKRINSKLDVNNSKYNKLQIKISDNEANMPYEQEKLQVNSELNLDAEKSQNQVTKVQDTKGLDSEQPLIFNDSVSNSSGLENNNIISDILEQNKMESYTSNILEKDKVESDTSNILGQDKIESDTSNILGQDKVELGTSNILGQDKVELGTSNILGQDKVELGTSNILGQDKVESDTSNILGQDKVESNMSNILEQDNIESEVQDISEEDEVQLEKQDDSISSDIKEQLSQDEDSDDSTTAVFYDEDIQRYCKRAKTYDELRSIHLKFTPEDVADVDKALEKVTSEIEAKIRAGQIKD